MDLRLENYRLIVIRRGKDQPLSPQPLPTASPVFISAFCWAPLCAVTRKGVSALVQTVCHALQSFREINLDIKQEVILYVTGEVIVSRCFKARVGGSSSQTAVDGNHLVGWFSHIFLDSCPEFFSVGLVGGLRICISEKLMQWGQGPHFENYYGRGLRRDRKPLYATELSSEIEGVGLSQLRCSLGPTFHEYRVEQVTIYILVQAILIIMK